MLCLHFRSFTRRNGKEYMRDDFYLNFLHCCVKRQVSLYVLRRFRKLSAQMLCCHCGIIFFSHCIRGLEREIWTNNFCLYFLTTKVPIQTHTTSFFFELMTSNRKFHDLILLKFYFLVVCRRHIDVYFFCEHLVNVKANIFFRTFTRVGVNVIIKWSD